MSSIAKERMQNKKTGIKYPVFLFCNRQSESRTVILIL